LIGVAAWPGPAGRPAQLAPRRGPQALAAGPAGWCSTPASPCEGEHSETADILPVSPCCAV